MASTPPAAARQMPGLFDETPSAITLLELQQRVGRLVAVPETAGVWITAELSDVKEHRSGHVYMDLLQKDSAGTIVASARAVVWSGRKAWVMTKFAGATGQRPASGMKVMVCVTVTHHPHFGLTYAISDIDPSYTMGDLERRRREILERLRRESVLEQNRELPWGVPCQRVAVVSARGAAGFGDFIKHLFVNPALLRFHVELFEAAMQGERTVATVLEALAAIAARAGEFDAVVIIRGGGATADLAAFESYELAAAVAMFPLPVVVGIGHERDTTVLDFVAARCVKTPTAAAQIFIDLGLEQLALLERLAVAIAQAPAERLAGLRRQLDVAAATLPLLPQALIERRARALDRLAQGVGAAAAVTGAARVRLDAKADALAQAVRQRLARAAQGLDASGRLLNALSPMATLRRGYSITRAGGRAVTSAENLEPGTVVETVLANGSFTSTVNPTPNA